MRRHLGAVVVVGALAMVAACPLHADDTPTTKQAVNQASTAVIHVEGMT